MEISSWPENLPSNRIKAIKELNEGQDLAIKLRDMLRRPENMEEGVDSLVVKILGTFNETLSILSSYSSGEVSQIPTVDVRSPSSWDGRKSEDSGESVKTTPPVKNKRGCYKRRKTSETNIIITSTLIDDGFAWRKYGQKEILNAKHQRNYYRCTHKFEQGCQATKQVQKTEDEPPKYQITYHGHHTCRNLLKAPQIIFNSPTSDEDSSILLNFETKQVDPSSSIKHGQQKDHFAPTSLTYDHSSPSDYYLSHHLVTSGPSELAPMMSSASNHGDMISPGVYSSTASTHGFEMEHLLLGPTEFSDFTFEL